ncbi:MAG: RNA polymerase sigma factor [Planctomycetes bacterium]|nr:RNA polymerase sigma factor [Planctomycetota bacterium]
MDRDTLAELVHARQAEIFRYLRYLGALDAGVAEDLAQETFLAAFRSTAPPPLDDERACAAWLRGIARNLFLMHCRRARANPVRTDEATIERAEAFWATRFLRSGDGFEYIEALRACVSGLSERARRLLDLCYAQRKSRDEMARSLDMSEDGIKSMLRRTRAALAECVRRRLAEAT